MSIQDAYLHELEQDLLALRQAYDRFFLRLERTPPDAARSALKRKLQRAQAEGSTQTRTSYQLRTLQASLCTYETLWDRKLTQQEQAHPQGAQLQKHAAPQKQAAAPVQTTSDPIARAHAALVEQYLRLGLAGAPRIEEVRKHLAAQLQQARDKGEQASHLGLKIITQEGLPTLVVVQKT